MWYVIFGGILGILGIIGASILGILVVPPLLLITIFVYICNRWNWALYLLYIIVTFIIDAVFVYYVIYHQAPKTDEYDVYRQTSPSSKPKTNKTKLIRWTINKWRLEKSAYVLLTTYSFTSGVIAFALICVYTINCCVEQALYSVDDIYALHWENTYNSNTTHQYRLYLGVFSSSICVFFCQIYFRNNWSNIIFQIICYCITPAIWAFTVYDIIKQDADSNAVLKDLGLTVITLYFVIFFTFYVALQCLSLLWYNYGDDDKNAFKLENAGFPHPLNAARVWRGSHLITTIFCCVLESNIDADTIYGGVRTVQQVGQMFCKYMAMQGLIWAFVYFLVQFITVLNVNIKINQPEPEWEPFFWLIDEVDVTKSIPYPVQPKKATAGGPLKATAGGPINDYAKSLPERVKNFCKNFIQSTGPFDEAIGLVLITLFKEVTFKQDKQEQIWFLIYSIITLFVFVLIKYMKWYGSVWSSAMLIKWWFAGKSRKSDQNFVDYWHQMKDTGNKEVKTKRVTMSTKAFLIGAMFAIFAICAAYIPRMFLREGFEYVEPKQEQIYTPYPVCGITGAENRLNVLDFAMFAMIPYEETEEKHKQILYRWFGDKYEYKYHEESAPSFFHIKSKENDYEYNVIALRGTQKLHDVLQDLSLWTEVASLHIVSWIFPLTSFLPDPFLESFIHVTSLGFVTQQPFYNKIYKYIANNLTHSLSEDSDYKKSIYIVGHSLGGGLAEIVAAKFANNGYTNVLSFGLSSPGVQLSSKKFNFMAIDLDKTSISVIPRGDVVPRIDYHGGLKQIIRCNEASFLDCHYAISSFCELYKSCRKSLTRNHEMAQCICNKNQGLANITCYKY